MTSSTMGDWIYIVGMWLIAIIGGLVVVSSYRKREVLHERTRDTTEAKDS